MNKYFALTIMACLMLLACKPDVNYVPFDYPDCEIYFPAAQAGIYTINELNDKDKPTATDPNAGVYKYIANKASNVFEIPLAVYRSGIHPDGDLSFCIEADEDTINNMIAKEQLDKTVLLPADRYELTTELGLKPGERTATFSVKVDFAFLHENAGKKYAFALHIAERSNALSTIIVVIDTKMLIPEAAFKPSVDASNYRSVYFLNNSEYITACTWDFGDGNISTEASPNYTYGADGTYQVKLTVTGLYGDETTTEAEVVIVSPKKD